MTLVLTGSHWSSSGPGAQVMPVCLGHALLSGTGEGDLHSIQKLFSAEPLKICRKRLEFIVATVWAPCLSLWMLQKSDWSGMGAVKLLQREGRK